MYCRGFKKGTTIPCGNKVPDAGYCHWHKDQDRSYSVPEHLHEKLEPDISDSEISDSEIPSIPLTESVEIPLIERRGSERWGSERWGTTAERISKLEKNQTKIFDIFSLHADTVEELQQKQNSQGKQIRKLFSKTNQLEKKMILS